VEFLSLGIVGLCSCVSLGVSSGVSCMVGGSRLGLVGVVLNWIGPSCINFLSGFP
jgi:hypothetical protein